MTGILDENRVTLPVRLTVSVPNEPNTHPAYGEKPIEMDVIATVRNLIVGKRYALLRYASYKNVPTKGDAVDFLSSNYDEKHEFVATDYSYVYADPKKVSSSGSTYYRCVETD